MEMIKNRIVSWISERIINKYCNNFLHKSLNQSRVT